MCADVLNLLAKVTKRNSGEHDRFQCWDVYQLWDNGQVTIDHCIEDEEWGSMDESREITETEDYPEDFFRTGFNRVIDQTGSMHEEPL